VNKTTPLPPLSTKSHVWTSEWTLPHESAFIVLQKYAWANLAGSGTIARKLFGKKYDSHTAANRELFGGEWIAPSTLKLPEGMSLDGRAHLINLPWMRLLCETRVLRFCVRCLAEGYHSLFFQIEALKCCPIHQEPLQSRCPHCCRATPPLALWAPTFERPFCCIGCSRPLAGGLTPGRWLSSPARVRATEAAFRPFAQWFERLRAFELSSVEVPLPHLSLAGAFHGERDGIVGFSIARSVVEFDFPEQMVEPSRRPLTLVPRDDPALTPPSLLAQHYWPSLLRMYRHVRKELFASIAGKHLACLPAARKGVWMQIDFGRYMLTQEPGLCPVAAGYVRWIRKALSYLSDLKRHLERLSEDRFVAPGENLKLQLMAEFYSCLAAAYVSEKLARGEKAQEYGTGATSPFMAQCSSGLADTAASLLITDVSGAVSAHWMVLGDRSLFDVADLHPAPARRSLKP
jgi:hypothetical protein